MNKILRALLAWLVMVSPSWAAMAHVQSQCVTHTSASQTSDTYTFPAALTSGNLVVFGAKRSSRTISSIVGDVSFSGSRSGSIQTWADGTIELWLGVAAGADTQVTINYSGIVGDNAMFCFAEFSGAASDQSGATANGATVTASAGTHSSGSVTPPTADNVVVAVMGRNNASWTDDADFTQVTTPNSAYEIFAYKIQSAATAQAYDASPDASKNSGSRIGAFAGASSAQTFGFRLRVIQ